MSDLTARAEPPLTHHPLCNIRLSLVNPMRGCTCELADRLLAKLAAQAQQIARLQRALTVCHGTPASSNPGNISHVQQIATLTEGAKFLLCDECGVRIPKDEPIIECDVCHSKPEGRGGVEAGLLAQIATLTQERADANDLKEELRETIRLTGKRLVDRAEAIRAEAIDPARPRGFDIGWQLGRLRDDLETTTLALMRECGRPLP